MIPVNFETRLHIAFKILRLIENKLEASYCDLDLTLSLNRENADAAKNKLKAMKIWLESFVDGCISYPVHTDMDTMMLSEVTNHVMMVPEDPHDHVLLMLLHTKLSTIGGDDVLILDSSLSSDTGEGFSCTVSGPIGNCLPTMEEWIGVRSFHKSPWWYRDDSSMFDMHPNEDEDITIVPNLGVSLLKLAKQTEYVRVDDDDEDDKPPAEIIKPAFKPRIIES